MSELTKRDAKKEELIEKTLLFVEKFGIKNFSTAAFIKYFKIGKSSLYHYFKSKDELLYEVYYYIAIEDLKEIEKDLYSLKTFEEKLERIFAFYLKEDEETLKFQEIFKEFLYLYSDYKNEKMQNFENEISKKMHNVLQSVFKEAIENKQIRFEALALTSPLIITAEGMLLHSFALKEFHLAKELKEYIRVLLILIKK